MSEPNNEFYLIEPPKPRQGGGDAKCTKKEFDDRVSLVLRWQMTGFLRRADILQLASKQDWGVSDRAVDYYIACAKKIQADIVKEERSEQFGLAVLRYNDLYAKGYQERQFGTCLSVQRELSSLFGLDEKRIRISGNLGVGLTDDEKRRIEKEFGLITSKPVFERELSDTMDSNKPPQDS